MFSTHKHLRAVVLLAALCVGATARAAILVEDFETQFPAWESGWLAQNSNLSNYYGVGAGRGNNPDGLWIGNSTTTFNSAFGSTITSLSIDVATYTTTNLSAWDSNGALIFFSNVIPTFGGTSEPGTYSNYVITSSHGISAFSFDGANVLGNTSIDNVVVNTGAGPSTNVPDASSTLLLSLIGIAGLVGLRRRIS